MNHPESEDHGPGRVLASSPLGRISQCGCGVITLSLQYMSLRFEADGFCELQRLLTLARCRLETTQPDGDADLPCGLAGGDMH